MKITRLALLAAISLCFSPGAFAQVLSSHAWIQGFAGSNFGVAHTDLDLDSGELAVWSDYQGLEGDLDRVEVLDAAGHGITQLTFNGPREGFAHGTTTLDPVSAKAVAQSGCTLRFVTDAFPSGEMEGSFGFVDPVSRTRLLDAAQVVGGSGATQATATMHLTRYRSGRFLLSGHTNGLDLPITGLELRGPAWFGEVGPLLLDLRPYDQSHAASSFLVDVPAGVLTASETKDVEDGFAYVLVRTNRFPLGALRGQTILASDLGDTYCSGRPHSASAVGARLSMSGSLRIADGDLILHGTSFPSGTPVLPLVGAGTGHVFLPEGSEGTLCLGGAPVVRLVAHLTQGAGFGRFDVPLDLRTLPAEAGLVSGDWLQFQCWFRDTTAGVPTSNFSEAIRVRPR